MSKSTENYQLNNQPDIIEISGSLRLVKYYENYKETLKWYEDKDICRQVDNIDHTYSLEDLKRMYEYLSSHGEVYYISYKEDDWKLIGDVSLWDNNIAIVITREYQNKHIGRKVISKMIERAKELGIKELKAKIYSFNMQSQKAFLSAGFKQINGEEFSYKIRPD